MRRPLSHVHHAICLLVALTWLVAACSGQASSGPSASTPATAATPTAIAAARTPLTRTQGDATPAAATPQAPAALVVNPRPAGVTPVVLPTSVVGASSAPGTPVAPVSGQPGTGPTAAPAVPSSDATSPDPDPVPAASGDGTAQPEDHLGPPAADDPSESSSAEGDPTSAPSSNDGVRSGPSSSEGEGAARPTVAAVSAADALRAAGLGVGVQVFLWGNPGTTERDLQLAREAGFTWVKQRIEWRYIQPSSRRQWDWAETDRIVNAVEAAGLKLIVRVDGQPEWARADGIFPEHGPPDKMSEWAEFLEEMAGRYVGRIHAYQVWNEPNLAREWGGVTPVAAEYATMLKTSYRVIKGNDPNVLVITAGLSPTTDDVSGQARPDVAYLQELYAAGAADSFDMLGAHAAGFKAEPETDPAEVAANPDLTNGDPSSADLKRVYAFRHVEDLRQVMEQNGDGAKQIAILEMGWTSDTRPGSEYAWFGVSEETKADYLARAIGYASANWSWVGLMSLIYLPDPSWTPDDEQFYWSLTDPDGSPRPAYDAVRNMLR